MKPFNRHTRGVLMAAAPVLPGGGGDPNAVLPPAPGQQPQQDEATRRMAAQLEQTRNQVAQLQRQVMAQPSQPPQGVGFDKRALEREFIQNPLDMSTAIAQRVVQEAIQQHGAAGFDTQVEMARSLARAGDPTFFDRYQAEIESTVAQVQPNLRINATVWKNALQMVKGQHADELIAAARTAAPTNEEPNRAPAVHVKSGSGPAAPSKAPAAPQAVKLTDEEARFAKRFKMDPAEYLKGKKENLEQSDFILDPLGASSWDKYVTFDSRDKRRADRDKRLAAAGKK